MEHVLFILYLTALIIVGVIASRKTGESPEDYFLANRTFGPVILFLTLAATNFSAFTFLGFAGAAYKLGFGQYGIMAAGTALMPIMFFILGRKIWRLGKKHGYMTPPELIDGQTKSYTLQLIYCCRHLCSDGGDAWRRLDRCHTGHYNDNSNAARSNIRLPRAWRL